MNEPNPDWVSAPYEEAGIVDNDLLWQKIVSFQRQFEVNSMTITIEKIEHGLFKYYLKQN